MLSDVLLTLYKNSAILNKTLYSTIMNLEDLKLVIITKTLDGVKRSTVGEVFKSNGQFKVRFDWKVQHEKWLIFALKSKRLKPYVTPAEFTAHMLRMRKTTESNSSGSLHHISKAKVQQEPTKNVSMPSSFSNKITGTNQ